MEEQSSTKIAHSCMKYITDHDEVNKQTYINCSFDDFISGSCNFGSIYNYFQKKRERVFIVMEAYLK